MESTSATFEAVNLGGVAPNLKFTLSIVSTNTVNIKWTISKDNYTPFEVPDDIIHVENKETLTTLAKFVKITDLPLEISIRDKNRNTVSVIKEFLLDEYLNYYY